MLKLSADQIELTGTHQLLELCEDISAPSWVESLFSELEALKLSEKIKELAEPRHLVNINFKNSFKSLETICSLSHGSVMNRVALMFLVLQSQDVSVTFEHIKHVLLQQAHKSQLKLLVPSDSVSVMLDCAIKLSLFDIHCFHTIAALLLAELIIHDFL